LTIHWISPANEKASFIGPVRKLFILQFLAYLAKDYKKSIAVIAFFHQKQTIYWDGN